MIKIFLMLCCSVMGLYAVSSVSPIHEIKVDGIVKDMTLHDDELLIGTDAGALHVYDYVNKVFTKQIQLDKVEDFVGDKIEARVFSVDKMQNRYLLLSTAGKGGYSNLWMHENNVTTQLLFPEDRQAVIKARFVDKGYILLGYLSNEAVLFDIKNKKELYKVQLSPSKFSDFALNEDKTQAVFSCESGVLSVIETKTGKVLHTLKGQNLDNVYKVDYKQGIVSAAGQDRRGALYDVMLNQGTYIEGSFLIYSTALSPSANKVAFTMDEKNNISIYNHSTKSKIVELQGQKSTLNTIIFKDENTLFSSSDDDTVMMWRLK
ncbi:MAG: Periplasmic nitrate reductase component NapL [uncultured Sulfurovum sp.]|uniref:Periplasmic nitrate reductase component NapL n=1 Tax=uncultured Sulfurovum sp. TaxID=269237 RepID=A0A6S6TQE3_9BACT|nr:MAG: Periplasmic nitrate reductase component NapL [uncultured Sulfurovum sp.]